MSYARESPESATRAYRRERYIPSWSYVLAASVIFGAPMLLYSGPSKTDTQEILRQKERAPVVQMTDEKPTSEKDTLEVVCAQEK